MTCPFFSDYYTLFINYCTLFRNYCTLSSNYCTLFINYCTLFRNYCTLFSYNCTLLCPPSTVARRVFLPCSGCPKHYIILHGLNIDKKKSKKKSIHKRSPIGKFLVLHPIVFRRALPKVVRTASRAIFAQYLHTMFPI